MANAGVNVGKRGTVTPSTRTSPNAGLNADPRGQNVSTIPNLGAALQSSNAWLGLSDRVGKGTIGARGESSHATYGGDQNEGYPDEGLFKGNSSGMPGVVLKQVNAGNQEMFSWNAAGEYGPGSPNYLVGGYGAREQMTIGGQERGKRGLYVGDGVSSTDDTAVDQYLQTGRMQVQMPSNQYLAGTDEARGANTYGSGSKHGNYGANNDENPGPTMANMPRSKRGIGKNYPRNDAKNQYD